MYGTVEFVNLSLFACNILNFLLFLVFMLGMFLLMGKSSFVWSSWRNFFFQKSFLFFLFFCIVFLCLVLLMHSHKFHIRQKAPYQRQTIIKMYKGPNFWSIFPLYFVMVYLFVPFILWNIISLTPRFVDTYSPQQYQYYPIK